MVRSLIKVGVFTIVIVFLIAIASILAYEARRRGKTSYCQNNLRDLGKIALDNIKDARENGKTILERGSEFWKRDDFMNEWKNQRAKNLDILSCPLLHEVSPDKAKPAHIDYIGPKFDPFGYKKDEPFAADKADNHGKGVGGNLLFLDLRVESQNVTVTDGNDNIPLWQKINQTTSE